MKNNCDTTTTHQLSLASCNLRRVSTVSFVSRDKYFSSRDHLSWHISLNLPAPPLFPASAEMRIALLAVLKFTVTGTASWAFVPHHQLDILPQSHSPNVQYHGTSCRHHWIELKLPNDNEDGSEQKDTIRVQIWRTLSTGDELSLSQLSKAVGERRRGELRSHLTHVERQAKTLGNKSDDWRIRRGLIPTSEGGSKNMQVKIRKGRKNETYIRLV